jgi:hypothetical protein
MDIVTVAANIAMQSAANYVHSKNLKVDATVLCEKLRARMKVALFAALDDAKQALDSGMNAIAESTFKASMVLVGIEAAKEATA